MTRFRLTNVERGGIAADYKANIEIDGRTVGYVSRARGSYVYRAWVGGVQIARAATLTDLRQDIRDHFSVEYLDAKESW